MPNETAICWPTIELLLSRRVASAVALLEDLGIHDLRLREIRIRQPGLDDGYHDLLQVPQ